MHLVGLLATQVNEIREIQADCRATDPGIDRAAQFRPGTRGRRTHHSATRPRKNAKSNRYQFRRFDRVGVCTVTADVQSKTWFASNSASTRHLSVRTYWNARWKRDARAGNDRPRRVRAETHYRINGTHRTGEVSWPYRKHGSSAAGVHSSSDWPRSSPTRNAPGARVLSVPCSAGEEPYSLAIALNERFLTPNDARIDAIDISERH